MKLTMISFWNQGQRYTGFVYMKPGSKLTQTQIEKIVGHECLRGSTITPGG